MAVPGIEQIDAMYRGELRSPDGQLVQPPWEIGTVQPAVAELVKAGSVVGAVLDAGCGSGRHAVYLAEAGYQVVGVDAAPAPSRKPRNGQGSTASPSSSLSPTRPNSTGSLTPSTR